MSIFKKKKTPESFSTVSDGLKSLYSSILLPLEEQYKFHDLQAPKLEAADFTCVPLVLLVGQYSVGKTSFIRYLLRENYSGMRIGPEPTTDGFAIIMNGENNRVIPGNALAVDSSKPFRSLSTLGNNFLNRLSCAEMDNDMLKYITFVDTPGILAGDKQTISRGYDFTSAVRWFAERSDRIILLFDAHKLDISDEFRKTIEILRPFDSKIRIILNKADSVNYQQLMRVYGALMWSLGKVINTPEVTRVYIGSFWDEPLVNDTYRHLFELEQEDLLEDLRTLPRNSTLRKLNDFIKRSRAAIINAYIVSALLKEMPMFGKEKKKQSLLANLPDVFNKIKAEVNLPIGDFPDVELLKERLAVMDFSKFKPLNAKLVQNVQSMLDGHVAKLMDMIPLESSTITAEESTVKGGLFAENRKKPLNNPFKLGAEIGFNLGASSDLWPVEQKRGKYDQSFDRMNKIDGKISGTDARGELLKSKLPNNVLGQIWNLSDIDKDGKLNKDEWALCNYLCDLKVEGHELPDILPAHLYPPPKM